MSWRHFKHGTSTASLWLNQREALNLRMSTRFLQTLGSWKRSTRPALPDEALKEYTLGQLSDVAEKGRQTRVRDINFWRNVGCRLRDLFLASRENGDMAVSSRSISSVLRCFKEMDVTDEVPVAFVMSHVLVNLSEYSIKDLSSILVSLSNLRYDNAYFNFYYGVADYISKNKKVTNNAQMSEFGFETWVGIISTMAKIGVPHDELFRVVAKQICTIMCSMNSRVSGKYLREIIVAYAKFRYVHNELLELAIKRVAVSSTTDEQLKDIFNALAQLKVEDVDIRRLVKLRLRIE